MIFCKHEVLEKLLQDSRVQFLTFIGSAKVGWSLRSKLAPGASCALEHGGVAPVIVDATADWEASIAPLVKGGYYHAGQVCVSVQRLYVDKSILRKFAKQFTTVVSELKVGDPMNPATQVGPLISPQEVNRVHEWVQEAQKAGGKILFGGKKISETCYTPTVILDPPDAVRLSQQEVFGPVVCLYTYHDLEEAFARANALPVSFQAGIFTQDLAIAWKAAHELKGMAVMINDHTAFRVDWMPFGGAEESGLGLGGIGYTMKEMTFEKLIVFRPQIC